MLTMIFLMVMAVVMIMFVFVMARPPAQRAVARRLSTVRGRYNVNGEPGVNEQVRKLLASRATIVRREKTLLNRFLPDPADIHQQIEAAGKKWTVRQYFVGSGIAFAVPLLALTIVGLPVWMAFIVGAAAGLGLPRLFLNSMAKRRIARFVARFPDALELLVRGLRAGLPIAETMGAVASEIDGPVGSEFQAVSDRMKIGRTLEGALQETADRLGTTEFQFFVITLAIQRETGGNLAETLSNLSDVLRKRMQMKLKISAMSSESKASAYIIGVLPFVVFGLISFISPTYMAGFFTDQRLMIAGMGGMIWMSVGAYIMRQMINFEI
ncbi:MULTISPECIES: type II secretion system F family protein [unclassified Sphingomonas]|uniref:type II secretion system F family protein n=1 Tax=unclassified Sphingomonas TaxID=196159 RepID=UPI0006FAD784|nr:MULTISPECIES: type II secretion system F family protein [unclassified Sphingomonas]KQX20259.1 pilus assembly protein TadB [Sphingomonas sp. Root1294]KQY67509.1 pilus assembly protein TadB [Sphingomonas sp. Root50]KRB90886.1 pilus assembly protein TadB [Sphingomonas sp. Root720]